MSHRSIGEPVSQLLTLPVGQPLTPLRRHYQLALRHLGWPRTKAFCPKFEGSIATGATR